MDILGIIPARGGSKSIPHKNIALLHGESLLSYTAKAALESKLLTRVILSTDSGEIANIGEMLGLEIPYLRPAELSQDTTPILPVIQHLLDWFQTSDSFFPEIIVLLQPTSPFRLAYHIDQAVKTLINHNSADSVVSVVKVPHNFTPGSLMRLDDGVLKKYDELSSVLRRQDKEKFFARNGPAVLAVRSTTILRNTLYGDVTLPYEMDRIFSLDIDEMEDLEFAEALLPLWEKHTHKNL